MTDAPKNTEGRIERRFAKLAAERRAGFIPFITAGDPDYETSLALLEGLPEAGADLIELGMPFSDPMADGPAIQASGLRALKGGQTLAKTLKMTTHFRARDNDTPLILMGYYNPVYRYGLERFFADAQTAGVDGLIIVDLPPEEEGEISGPLQKSGLRFIRMTAPTSDVARLTKIMPGTKGFIYHVSITGVTGTQSAKLASIKGSVERIRGFTELPIAVGFGIRTRAQIAEISEIAEACVVGSALVNKIYEHLDENGTARTGLVPAVLEFAANLAQGTGWQPGALKPAYHETGSQS